MTLTTIYPMDTRANAMTFDASIEENHQGDTVVTDHPVEGGADITDHIRRAPEMLTMSAAVTNTPVVFAGVRSPVRRGGSATQRAEDAYEFIKRHKNQGTLMGISTTLRSYSNMVITSLAVTRNSTNSDSVFMDLVLREIVIAVTDQVTAPKAPSPKTPQRRRKTNKGKKQKAAASKQQSDDFDGSLSDIFTVVGKFTS